MKEIGGYFGLEEFSGKEYYSDLIAVNNARNALVYLLKARKIKKLYIPFFLCDSVSQVCLREKCAFECYHIDKDFRPLFTRTLEENAYLYVVNFYGQVDKGFIISLKQKYGRIILDNVQAFFEEPIPGIDTVYSCRKFFGVPDGGYVATDVELDEQILLDISKDRMTHVLGRFEGETASDYYDAFKANDAMFKELELRRMSKLTHNILRAIDYHTVKTKREENFSLLHSTLEEYNKLHVHLPAGPYAYPFYCENGMQIKKVLAKNNIFVATLWPNVLDMEATLEKEYAENILPLPCDQRYDVSDISYLLEVVLKYV